MLFNDPYQKALADYKKDVEQLSAIAQRLIDGLKADSVELLKLSATKRRNLTKKEENAFRDIEAKYRTFLAQKAKVDDGLRAAENRYYAAIDAEDEKLVTQIRGVAVYPGPHGGHAGFRYLAGECEAYAALKGNFAARRAQRDQVFSVLSSVVDAIETANKSTSPINSKIAQHERISDPERASQFYRKHRDEILSEFGDRQAAENQPKA